MPKSFGKKIAKGFGKNLAKSFKYGVIDTFLEKNAPDILETMRSNKDEIKSLIESSGLKDLSKKDIGEMLNKQTTEIKKSLGEVKKNLLSDIKSGRWFGNQERSSEIMTKFIFGGEDEFNDFFNDDLYNDLDDDSETSSSSEEFGDIDFNFENSNETNITDNRANVNNITTIENRVDGKLLASVTSQLVGSMSTVSTQIKQISQFHLDETRQYYSDSLRLLTDINNTLKNVYTLQTPKGKTSVLEEVFTGNSLNILSYGKAIAGDVFSMITDEDNRKTIKTIIDGVIADPLKAIISETMDLVTPKAIKKGMEELNSGFIDTVKTLVMQLSEGKNGKGTPLQKFLGSFLGLNMSTGNGKAAFKNAPVPFDSETKRSIVNTIPELLSRIYGKVASISSNGNGEDNISGKDRILRVDYNSGELGYDVNKKVRKSDSVFAKKLAGGNYDYSRAGLTKDEATAQRKIDRLNKQIEDLQNNRSGFLDNNADKEIYRLRQRIKKFTDIISDEGKDKIRQAQKTRDEDYEEYSEMLYKYAVDLGSKRGLSPSVIKTINAKELDRRNAGGIVSNTELSKDIEKLSLEQKRVFASLIKQIETYNANRQDEIDKRTSKEIWQDSKDKNRRADGKLGIKGSFKAISDYTNEISKQFFDKLNKGLSNVIFGNENGLKKNATNKFKEKVNGWVDKYKDETNKRGKNTLRSKIAKKIDIFNKNRESERERREKEMAAYQKRSADAVEAVMDTLKGENCGHVRFGNETEEHGVIMQLKEWLSIKLGNVTDKVADEVADEVGVSTTETKIDDEGNTVVDDDGNVVEQHRPTADIKSDIKSTITSKIKNKIMSDKMKTDGVSENEKITKLLHLRMKEFMDPVTSTFKEKFFGDNEDSLKSKINEKLFSDNEDSVKSQIKNFLFGGTDSAGNKTKKSLLDRLSGDFISYLRNPTDKDGKPLGKGNSFIDKWKDTLGIFTDELRHFGRIAIDIVKKGLKFYYKTLFSIVKKGFKLLGSSGVTKFGTEMGKRVMGVTNFINKRMQSIERDQWERVGGVLKKNEETGNTKSCQLISRIAGRAN